MTQPDASCVSRVLRSAVFIDVLNPADAFQLFLRKLLVLNGAFFAVVTLALLAIGIAEVTSGKRAVDATFVIYAVVLAFFAATSGAVYAYTIATGDVPDGALATQLVGAALGGLTLALIDPVSDLVAPCAAYAVFASICGLPRLNVFIAFLVLVLILYSWNHACVTSGATCAIALAGYRTPHFADAVIGVVTNPLSLFAPVAACQLHVRHHKKMFAAADAATQLSRRAAELLGGYDTDGVAALLEEYASQPGADPALLASYGTLVANLNRYRPHLPHWMVAPRGPDTDMASIRSTSSADGQEPRSPLVDVLAGPVDAEDSLQELADIDALLNTQRVTRKVAVALVDFCVDVAQPAGEQAATISEFVDVMLHVSRATQAAMHSFVGDTVQVSWNAATRCALPEVKAVRLLGKLKAIVDGGHYVQHMTVSAAAMSGEAVSQFAGSRVSAFTLALPWRPKLSACVAFAKQHASFCCSDGLAVASEDVVATRPVELLSVTVGGASSTVVVHEVLGEQPTDDDSDQWLNMLRRSTRAGRDTSALQLCADGRYAEAITALGPMERDTPSRLITHLRGRATAAMANPAAPFAVCACSCDSS
jgi:hypothetical protein